RAHAVERDEHDVAQQPPQRLQVVGRLEDAGEIRAYEKNDDGGCENVLNGLCQPSDKPGPGADGAACERVGAAGVRQSRRHLGKAAYETEIHDGDDDRSDEQSAPTSSPDAEIPP